jgi:hypothetical protein
MLVHQRVMGIFSGIFWDLPWGRDVEEFSHGVFPWENDLQSLPWTDPPIFMRKPSENHGEMVIYIENHDF